MSAPVVRQDTDSPERYELEREPFPHELPIRPNLFALFGPGIATLVEIPPADPAVREFAAWLHVGDTGRVTVCSGKAEVGQNIRTSLALAAADELLVPVESVDVILGDTDLTPFDMGTFGSRTTPFTAPQIRRAAAGAREFLIDLAAAKWRCHRNTLYARQGTVCDPRLIRAISYGDLVRSLQKSRIITQDQHTKPGSEWTIAGRSAPKSGGRAFVTGRHKFASDLSVEGMLVGKVLRAPSPGAVLRSVDLSRVSAMPAVFVVHEEGFVAVAAPSRMQAMQALAAIDAEWDIPTPSTQNLAKLLRPSPAFYDQNVRKNINTIDATYTIAYVAHVPLEPRAALAHWVDGKLTVWTGTQRPFGVREELAAACGISIDQVRVIAPDTGSGYGGKHTGEAAVEAARIARAVGKPIKLVWSREEEFLWAYLRPAGVIDVSASVNPDATIREWEFHNFNSGGAAIQSPYAIAEQKTEFHEVESPLRQGSYRGLAAAANNFVRECHMDDLAAAAHLDPLDFRLLNCVNDRLRDVLLAAAKGIGWNGRDKAPGRGFGVAGGTEKGSYIANCVEIEVGPNGSVKVLRIVAAFECGAIVNPLHLENQVEGAIVMGLGPALFEEIRFGNGAVQNPRLSQYRVPRFSDTPPIEIILIDRKDLPSVGAGETPIMAIAPAIGNAMLDATGVRTYSMPLVQNGFMRE